MGLWPGVEGAQEIQMEPGGCHLHQDGPEETGDLDLEIARARGKMWDVQAAWGLPESPAEGVCKRGIGLV